MEAGTSWFKHKTPKSVSRECRMQQQLERHIFAIMLAAMNSGRGGHSQFFFEDLGLALAPKICPDQSQTFIEVNSSQAFIYRRKEKKWHHFFQDEPRFQVLQGMFVQSFAQIFEELTA